MAGTDSVSWKKRKEIENVRLLAFFLSFSFNNLQINGLVSPFVFPEKQQHKTKELFSKKLSVTGFRLSGQG